MADVFYWFGVGHAAFYAIAGFIFASRMALKWMLQRFQVKAEMARIYVRMLKERREASQVPSRHE